MSASESPPQSLPSNRAPHLPPVLQSIQERQVLFRPIIEPYMDIETARSGTQARRRVVVFQGKLSVPAQAAYAALENPVHQHNHTLYLSREGGQDQIIVVEGVLVARRINPPWWIHALLLALTMLTTLFAAAMLYGYTAESLQAAIENRDRITLLQIYRRANNFAWPLLFILGVHEMGHYIAARLHGVKTTLPFFIPLPLFGSLGTLGAVILIKSPFLNRKQLFDVGIAGPLAGLVTAIVIFLWGIENPTTIALLPRDWLSEFNAVNVPPLLEFVASFTKTEYQVSRLDINVFYRYPTALAAWFGVLLTALNLLPMGQFDGGHVAFAMFGRRIAWPLAQVMALTCVFIGISGVLGLTTAWPIWFIWPLFAYLTGLRHPPPHNDITPIGWPRFILGLITFGLLLSMIVITPFYRLF